MKILLIGPQGSGKSTQAKLLSEYLVVPVISTGDIFRILSLKDTKQGKVVKKILDEGNLVDDQTTSKIVGERVKEQDCEHGFIMDGYPRTIDQIRLFDPQFDLVIFLNLSDEEATHRLLARGRTDDTKELINQRLKLYHQNTDPIAGYFRKRGQLIEIDGRDTIDNTFSNIRKVLDEQSPK